jgi:hypothetical protein
MFHTSFNWLALLVLIGFAGQAQAYDLKTIMVSGYSKPWMIITASDAPIESVSSIHLHLHGWTQDPTTGKAFQRKFDFDWIDPQSQPEDSKLKSFVESYDLQKELDLHPDRAILVPLARGHCDQYPELMQDFSGIWKHVLEAAKINPEIAIVHQVSAHSGGGEYLAKLLMESKVFESTKRATLIDAVYHDGTMQRLLQWVKGRSAQETIRVLEMPVIPRMAPARFGSLIMDSIPTNATRGEMQIGNHRYHSFFKKSMEGNLIYLFTEMKPQKLDHWSIVKSILAGYADLEIKRTPSSKKNSR